MKYRWHAIVHYRTNNGPLEVGYDIEEIHHLHDFVELGPHWDTVQKIEIFRVNHCTSEALTVEQAEQM